jgi:archaellum component FlaC
MKKAPKKITTLVEAKKEITRLRTQITNIIKVYEKLLTDLDSNWEKILEKNHKEIDRIEKQNQVLELKCQEYELQLAPKCWQIWK